MRENIKYPVGDQSFESIRTDGYLYIDKTMYIEKLLNGSKYIFLSRPRRFGKSLFLSMLKCFFEGRKELFKGLYADTMQWDWAAYPIFHLDLNNQKYRNDTDLEVVIEDFLINLEKKYCVTPPQTNHSVRLANLMKAAFEATGKKVVILVDEYDKPLVNNIHDRERFETYRDKLSALYSNFKSSADFIRLVFLTGVSRFGKLSVFSSLNNLSDISFDEAYASICGITEQELRAYFKPGFEAFVEKEKITSEELFLRLKKWYDGYHFSIDCTDIYNPFSILCAFDKLRFRNYWIASGTPTLLVEQLIKTETNLEELIHTVCPQSELEGLDVDNIIPVALLYQTGYLTIKDYDAGDDIFTLGIPNEEVKRGFFEFILPYYTNIGRKNPRILIIELRKMLEAGEVENFMTQLASIFSGISYEMELDEEKNVQNALLIIFTLLGIDVNVEYRTSNGRIDILVRTKDFVYIIELKFNGSASDALNQILEKEYFLPWKATHRHIIAIGINYTSKLRRITKWESAIIQ